MATAAPTHGRRCAGTSRSTATTSRLRRSRRWLTRSAWTPRPSPAPSRLSASIRSARSRGRPEGEPPMSASPVLEVRVPDMGNFKDVAVIDVLVKPGESVEVDTPLVTLESEKASMDVPSTASGVIEKVHVAKGGTVSPGDLIVTVRAAAAQTPAPAPEAVKTGAADAPAAPAA